MPPCPPVIPPMFQMYCMLGQEVSHTLGKKCISGRCVLPITWYGDTYHWHICEPFTGIFKTNSQCDNPLEGGTGRPSGRRQKRHRRGRKGGVIEARSYPHQSVSLQEDTPNSLDDRGMYITDRSTDGSNQPTDVTSDCSSTGNKNWGQLFHFGCNTFQFYSKD